MTIKNIWKVMHYTRIMKDGFLKKGFKQIEICDSEDDAKNVLQAMWEDYCDDQGFVEYRYWVEDYRIWDDVIEVA